MVMLKYYPYDLILVLITPKSSSPNISIPGQPVWHNDKRDHIQLSNMNINLFNVWLSLQNIWYAYINIYIKIALSTLFYFFIEKTILS